MTRHTLTVRQQPIVLDLLKAHCRKDTNGRAIYDDGWDDERVLREAEEANPEKNKPIMRASVNRYRSQLYGFVRQFKPKSEHQTKQGKVEAEIIELQQRVNAVIDWVSNISKYLQATRGYQPPPGRPQSTPREGEAPH